MAKARGGKPAATPVVAGDTRDADLDVFQAAMRDVVRRQPDVRGHARLTTRPVPVAPERPIGDEVDGPEESFAASGVDRRELRKLKRGDYVAARRSDLHGMTAVEAGAAVRRFLDSSRHAGHRCVCIVHGRGLHSRSNEPVLKTRVRALLRAHPAVLAFADAPRSDGGSVAVYVLVRK